MCPSTIVVGDQSQVKCRAERERLLSSKRFYSNQKGHQSYDGGACKIWQIRRQESSKRQSTSVAQYTIFKLHAARANQSRSEQHEGKLVFYVKIGSLDYFSGGRAGPSPSIYI